MKVEEQMIAILNDNYGAATINDEDQEQQIFNLLQIGFPLVERHKILKEGEYRYRVCSPPHQLFGYEASLVIVVKEKKLEVIKFTQYYKS